VSRKPVITKKGNGGRAQIREKWAPHALNCKNHGQLRGKMLTESKCILVQVLPREGEVQFGGTG